GPCRVIPLEMPKVTCRSVDVVWPASRHNAQAKLVDSLLAEALTPHADPVVAYRGHYRWVHTVKPVHAAPPDPHPRLRARGVYLITGGLGSIGLTLAEYLAQQVQAKLVLIGRSALPPRAEWSQWLADHPEQDSTSDKIRQIQALEAVGAEVLPVS